MTGSIQVAIIFLFSLSVVAKVASPSSGRQLIESLGSPRNLSGLVLVAAGAVESGIVVLLLLGLDTLGLLVATLLFLVYAGALATILLFGISVNCGCLPGGDRDQQVGFAHVVRALVLAVLGVVGFSFRGGAWGFTAGTMLLGGFLASAVGTLPQWGHRLAR